MRSLNMGTETTRRSVVTKDVPVNRTTVGNLARIIQHDDRWPSKEQEE